MSRTIVHLDADAFFAAVEQAADPKLRGKPIAVGGEKRGIVASASYEARKFGVYTPMPTVLARKLCPKLIVLPGDFERYEQFSNWMFGYAYDFTPDVEQTSIDEGYFDLTANRQKPATEIALTIRKAIGQKLKISVSEGIGSNKLVSAVASKLSKPAAFVAVMAGNEKDFLGPLANKWLPGVGPQTSARLTAAGLAKIGQIAGTPTEMLELLMGSQATTFRRYANGIDDRPLVPAREPQRTFSQQETFPADLTDEEYVDASLRRMADQLFAKLREERRSIRTLTVRVRYNDMAEDQASESLWEPTDLETDVYTRVSGLLRRAWKRRVSLRLISLKLSNVYDGRFRSELALEVSAQRLDAETRLAAAIDTLRSRLGAQAVLRGHDLRLRLSPASGLAGSDRRPRPVRRTAPAVSTPLRVRSYYSFLDSTLSPTEVVALAKQHGLPAVGMTDLGNLHGAVEFCHAAKRAGIKPILGAELLVDARPLVLHVESAEGYHHLCQILSGSDEGSARGDMDDLSVAARQRRSVRLSALLGKTAGLIAVGENDALAELFPGRFYRRATSRTVVSHHPVVACPPVHFARPEDQLKHRIVQSIRTLTLLQEAHPEKESSRYLHFRSPSEMAALYPEAWLRASAEIAERCQFEFPFGPPQFPEFQPPDGTSSRVFLRNRVVDGLQRRYRDRAATFRAQAEEELAIIAAVGYESYFLLVWDLLQDCRRAGIDWITRGSAADSLVCYCLGISDVCPIRFELYFKRFLNPERMALNKLPDIDIDFPHDRKDDVVQLLYTKHGPEHCAMVGGFSTFQSRSAFAEVAKVLGVAERDVRRFTERFPWSFSGGWPGGGGAEKDTPGFIEQLLASPETRDLPVGEEPYRTALETAAFLNGFPRNPKMHPCGVVLSCQPMHELTPTFISNKGLPTTHYDMDGVEDIGLVKIDVLAQGGLSVMRDARNWITQRGVTVDLGALEPWEDPEVWEMIAHGGARAVHHIESPAMVGLCGMTNVREIDGLVAIVSVIRPGAANESKKLSFTRRYQGMEPVSYPHPCLEDCLHSTFGLVVYEEHILQISEAFAGLSAGRADMLRRGLVKQKTEVVAEIGKEFMASARARGHSEAKIAEVWALVTGFSGFGFNRAHSTAYALEAYQAAWLKCYHPAEFMAGVLTHGKGFYHPVVYVLECHRLGLKLLPPSVNEPGPAFVPCGTSIRVPLTRLKGLTTRTITTIVQARELGPYTSLEDFFRRVAPSAEEIEGMIRVGGFDEFGETRIRQFWQAQHLLRTFGASADPLQGWLIAPPGLEHLPQVPLREPTPLERLESEIDLLGFVASGHPLDVYPDIAWDTYCPVHRLREHVGQVVTTCGLVVEQRTHHQATGEPMKFLTLADRTGIVETELFAATYRSHGLATVRYPVLEVTAKVEPFENGQGFSLRVLRAGAPRRVTASA